MESNGKLKFDIFIPPRKTKIIIMTLPFIEKEKVYEAVVKDLIS